MAASLFSDTVAAELLDYWFRAVAPTPPATFYAGLSSTQPASDGTNITEPTDVDYARIAQSRASGTFNAPSARGVTNFAAWTWPTLSTGGSGAPGIGWVPLFDSLTGGAYLGCLVVTGGLVSFDPGVAPQAPAGSLLLEIPATS